MSDDETDLDFRVDKINELDPEDHGLILDIKFIQRCRFSQLFL